MRIAAILHHPHYFSKRSGLVPLAEKLEATVINYDETWRIIQKWSWTTGYILRKLGNCYYGSEWNALLPFAGEISILSRLPAKCDVVHFMWAEFAAPRLKWLFHKKARCIIGTFHASASRLPSVLKYFKWYDSFDGIILVSESQRAFFVNQGIPNDRIATILHGVDTTYFRPAIQKTHEQGSLLRGIMVGSTERDHAFMAELLKALPRGVLDMTILTAFDQRVLNYKDVQNARFVENISDDDLLALYQQADLLVMPMTDCTANNAILEAMACGTPVLTNRVGGITEYVDPSCNFIMEKKCLSEWVDLIIWLQKNKNILRGKRAAVRAWAESFSWSKKAEEHKEFYIRCYRR